MTEIVHGRELGNLQVFDPELLARIMSYIPLYDGNKRLNTGLTLACKYLSQLWAVRVWKRVCLICTPPSEEHSQDNTVERLDDGDTFIIKFQQLRDQEYAWISNQNFPRDKIGFIAHQLKVVLCEKRFWPGDPDAHDSGFLARPHLINPVLARLDVVLKICSSQKYISYIKNFRQLHPVTQLYLHIIHDDTINSESHQDVLDKQAPINPADVAPAMYLSIDSSKVVPRDPKFDAGAFVAKLDTHLSLQGLNTLRLYGAHVVHVFKTPENVHRLDIIEPQLLVNTANQRRTITVETNAEHVEIWSRQGPNYEVILHARNVQVLVTQLSIFTGQNSRTIPCLDNIELHLLHSPYYHQIVEDTDGVAQALMWEEEMISQCRTFEFYDVGRDEPEEQDDDGNNNPIGLVFWTYLDQLFRNLLSPYSRQGLARFNFTGTVPVPFSRLVLLINYTSVGCLFAQLLRDHPALEHITVLVALHGQKDADCLESIKEIITPYWDTLQAQRQDESTCVCKLHKAPWVALFDAAVNTYPHSIIVNDFNTVTHLGGNPLLGPALTQSLL